MDNLGEIQISIQQDAKERAIQNNFTSTTPKESELNIETEQGNVQSPQTGIGEQQEADEQEEGNEQEEVDDKEEADDREKAKEEFEDEGPCLTKEKILDLQEKVNRMTVKKPSFTHSVTRSTFDHRLTNKGNQ